MCGKHYHWDDERRKTLVELVTRVPRSTQEEIAAELNTRHPVGILATQTTVRTKIGSMRRAGMPGIPAEGCRLQYSWGEDQILRRADAHSKINSPCEEKSRRLLPSNSRDDNTHSIQRRHDDSDKVKALIQLACRTPKLTLRKIADKLNATFREGRAATLSIVKAKLNSLSASHLVPPAKKMAPLYPWDDDRVKLLARMARRKKRPTHQQIADALNEAFGMNPPATATVVKSKLYLMRQRGMTVVPPARKRNAKYNWTPKREQFLIELFNADAPYKTIADRLNRRFRGEVPATSGSVNKAIHRLKGDGVLGNTRYRWTRERKGLLMELIGSDVPLSYVEIAARLNERFPDGPKATVNGVRCRLNKMSRSDTITMAFLRKVRTHMGYRWTPAREAYAIELRNQGVTYREIAEGLNRRFRSNVKCDGARVGAHFQKFRENGMPDVPMARNRAEPYPWDDEREQLLTSLKADGLTCKKIADELNRRFPAGTRATKTIVYTKDLSRRRKESGSPPDDAVDPRDARMAARGLRARMGGFALPRTDAGRRIGLGR